MIHMSWSLPLLLTVLVAMWLPYILNFKLKIRVVSFKRYLLEYICALPIVAFLAFDVGTPQHQLNRSKFNQEISQENFDKVESNRNTVDVVKEKFKTAIEENHND